MREQPGIKKVNEEKRKKYYISRKKPKKPNNYVDNKELYAIICQYKEKIKQNELEGKEKPKIPDKAASAIFMIANNLASTPSFSRYSFKDEMIGYALENCIRYFDRFDEKNYKNPFAYFTQIITFAFLRKIGLEKKEMVGRQKLTEIKVVEGGVLSRQPGDSSIYSIELPKMDSDYIKNLLEDTDTQQKGDNND